MQAQRFSARQAGRQAGRQADKHLGRQVGVDGGGQRLALWVCVECGGLNLHLMGGARGRGHSAQRNCQGLTETPCSGHTGGGSGCFPEQAAKPLSKGKAKQPKLNHFLL